jgi:hypothetical protein
MCPDEASSVLYEGAACHRDYGQGWWDMTSDDYHRLGVKLYYARDRNLHGVSIDARRGPQVLADGIPLVGQVPSEIDRWVEERANSTGRDVEIAYLGTGDIVSRTLGAAFCVQRARDPARDRLVTRPVFLSDPAMDDPHHQLPGEAWAIF